MIDAIEFVSAMACASGEQAPDFFPAQPLGLDVDYVRIVVTHQSALLVLSKGENTHSVVCTEYTKKKTGKRAHSIFVLVLVSCRTFLFKQKGMSVTDTLEFVLSCYDFDGTGRLTVDEISLAFKSTVTGMCKLEGAGGLKACPRDVDFEAAAMNAFERRGEGPDRFKVKVRERPRFQRIDPRLARFATCATSGYFPIY